MRSAALLAAFACACAAPCNTADLDAKYALDLVRQCDQLPLSECPYAERLGEEYEAAVVERLKACQISK